MELKYDGGSQSTWVNSKNPDFRNSKEQSLTIVLQQMNWKKKKKSMAREPIS
jgi:hypothetical protein